MISNIKDTQLTRTGYSYQDLLCIQILVNWFRNPELYKWVSIEGAETAPHKFRGLDDVVALNRQDKFELYQVKFTIDSTRSDLSLSFDWLMKTKKKGTSLLQKWAHDIQKYIEGDLLAVAALKTNRIPDAVLSSCLNGNIVDVNKIPEQYLNLIQTHLGGVEITNLVFSQLEFHHGLSEHKSLEEELHDNLVPDHTTEEGWLRFLRTVELWATRRGLPSPDGKIMLHHLQEIFTAAISNSLSQFFEIPSGYTPPSEAFHEEIVNKTKEPGAWVISGRPGMGKSTYLSYLTSELAESEVPVVRHHYSLTSISDVDRISFSNVCRSIQFQLKNLFPELLGGREINHDELGEWLDVIAERAQGKDPTLVVIIDGLDHVGRERSDISQLEHLVNRLLPLKDRVCILFGTQPISNVDLPKKLVAELPREKYWSDLPSMDRQAIRNWLKALVDDGKINIQAHSDRINEELTELSEAFFSASSGYPVYLMYSLRLLSYNEKHINKYDVEKLPRCPDGDIHKYYEVLWASLSAEAREVLLQIACVEFSWPNRESLATCFKDSLSFTSAYDEIQHLFESRVSGIIPFHSSIMVYLKNKREYSEMAETLMRRAQNWLEDGAPKYWKWGWEWVVASFLGDSDKLLNGLTRDWLIDSICNGYPHYQIERILSIAERKAFTLERYADLVRLRLLRIRLVNGPDFQIQNYHEFCRLALSLSGSREGINWRIDNLSLLPDTEIAMVASLSSHPEYTERCFTEILKRIRFYARTGTADNRVMGSLLDSAFDCLTVAQFSDVNKILWLLGRLSEKDTYFTKVIEKLMEHGNAGLILEIPKEEIPEGCRNYFWNNFVLACSDLDISIFDRPEIKDILSCENGALLYALAGNRIDVHTLKPVKPITSHNEATSQRYVRHFFVSLIKQLLDPQPIVPDESSLSDSADEFAIYAFNFFKIAACRIADLFFKGIKVDVLQVYHWIAEADFPKRNERDFDSSSVWHAVSKALTEISITLHRLLKNLDKLEHPDTKKFSILKSNDWWIGENWLRECAKTNILDMTPEEVTVDYIRKGLQDLRLRKDSTNSLASDGLELCRLAFIHNLKEEASIGLTLTAKHIFGYGHRKDITLHELYEAIHACGKYQIGDMPNWLGRISPFTTDVFHYTEREIRHIPGWRIRLIAQFLPERLGEEFKYHLLEQHWSICEEILKSYIEYLPLDSVSSACLLRSQSTYETITKIAERSVELSSLSEIYEEQIMYFGGLPPADRESSTSTLDDPEDANIEVSNFPPDRLIDLCNALRAKNIIYSDNLIKNWIEFWVNHSRGLDVLTSYEQLLNGGEELPHVLKRNLDEIFDLSLKLKGSAKSYWIALRSIKENRHWSRYSGSRSEAALARYANIYNKSWRKLLRDSLSEGESISVGQDWIYTPTSELVKFLLVANEGTLAAEVTETMLKCLEDETSHLHLTPLYWSKNPISVNDVPATLLLWIYKWPDKVSRLRTATQIASLLDEDIIFRKQFLFHMRELKYEIDIHDYLQILHLTKSLIFREDELKDAISFPSILSQSTLASLGYSLSTIDTKAMFTENFFDIQIDAGLFAKSLNGIPHKYSFFLKKLGSKTGYPLLKHFEMEWSVLRYRQGSCIFNFSDFCSGQFYAVDRIVCNLSSHAETMVLSAYLRTLSFAQHTLGVEESHILSLAEEAVAFEDKILQPSAAPSCWPKLPKIEKDEDLPGEIELENILLNISKSSDFFIFASGPLLRSYGGVCIDLEIQAIYTLDEHIQKASFVYESIERDVEGTSIHPLSSKYLLKDFGRWGTDKLTRGLTAPNFYVSGDPPHTEYNNTSIEYFSGGILNATWRYWHQNWFPASYFGLGPNTGTYTTVPRETWDAFKYSIPGNLYLLGKLTIVDNRRYSREEEPIRIYSLISI